MLVLSTRRPIHYPTRATLTRAFSSSKNGSESNNDNGHSEEAPRGNFWIRLGWAILALAAIDQALQYKQEMEAKEHRRMLYQMQEEANHENEVQWEVEGKPVLFSCKIMHTEISLDGTKMLRNIAVGDEVEVLEADIGPNKAYHLCRNPNSDRPGSIGWYPIEFMKRSDS